MIIITRVMKIFVLLTLYSLATQVQGIKEESFEKTIVNEITKLKIRQDSCDARVSQLEATVKELKNNNAMLENLLGMTSSIENNNESQDNTDNFTTIKTRQNRMLTSGPVAFTVGVSSGDLRNLGDHHTIIFDHAITNSGGAYSLNSGIFQAPIKGIYVFTMTLMVVPRHSEYLDIVVDGKLINQIFADASSVDDYMSTTKQWVLDLNVGSEVWIRTDSYGNRGEIHGAMHTTFSGFLLFETE